VCLKKELSVEKYNHFLLLSTSIYILASKVAVDFTWLSCAEKMLKKFISQTETLYGSEFLVYNMHALSHLHTDVQNFGPLDGFSAFPFENHMQNLKRMLRAKNKPFQQCVNRIYEMDEIERTKVALKPKLGSKLLDLNKNELSFKQPDNCCLTTEYKFVLVLGASESDEVICQEFLDFRRFYSYPIDSIHLKIFVIHNLNTEIKCIDRNKLLKKCYLIPYEQTKFVAIPLL